MHQLRFLHIPKTAGTTFTQILSKQYKTHFQFSGNMTEDVKKLNTRTDFLTENINLYSGHAPIETGIDHIDKLDTITLLRDPVERVKSYCQHIAEGKDQRMRFENHHEQFDLDDFLHKGYFELNNLQTQMLINHKICATEIKTSHELAYNQAFKNLTEKITAFGLLEYFDESLILFQKLFNWQTPTYTSINKKNNKKKLVFLPRHIERIKVLNRADIMLYQSAKKLFLSQLKSSLFDPDALAQFKIKNNPKVDHIPQKSKSFLSKIFKKF